MDEPKYIGHMKSCAHANEYIKKYYPDAPYTICLQEDYINLPPHILKREVNED